MYSNLDAKPDIKEEYRIVSHRKSPTTNYAGKSLTRLSLGSYSTLEEALAHAERISTATRLPHGLISHVTVEHRITTTTELWSSTP